MRARAQLLPLWIPEPDIAPGPDLRTYHRIVVNSSAGKDSQAALDVTVEQARAADVLDRLVVAHADLGDNEWPGVPELAAEHAAHYGLRFEIVARRKADGTVDTILDRVAQRGLWPDAKRRWCTSDHKRDPRMKLFTRLVAELRESGAVTDGPIRILSVMGMRAAESCERTNAPAFRHERRASNGLRHVDEWRPLHTWTTEQVWARIARAGTQPHPAYAAGMSRLSCAFCVRASRRDLVCSARLNPELADRYLAVEKATGHQFQQNLSMAEVVAEARSQPAATTLPRSA